MNEKPQLTSKDLKNVIKPIKNGLAKQYIEDHGSDIFMCPKEIVGCFTRQLRAINSELKKDNLYDFERSCKNMLMITIKAIASIKQLQLMNMLQKFKNRSKERNNMSDNKLQVEDIVFANLME